MNGIRLFRVLGITVYLHWSWFLVAAYEIQTRRTAYDSILWNVLEYLMVFVIVLLHEFGHALACRSVGGSAERIMLWPLGGVAFVNPPPRPGAVLWSIAAGPLVNVVLLLISLPLLKLPLPVDIARLVHALAIINGYLLIFNMLPIYPLDGGQILQSLLWFVIGRGRSLKVSAVIGVIGALGLGALALYEQSFILGLIAIFAASQCWTGWKYGTRIRELENVRPRPGFACPICSRPPLVGKFWTCSQCNAPFDTFETGALCPQCGHQYDVTECPGCKQRTPIQQWRLPIQNTAPTSPLISQGQANPQRTGWL
jgi:Zn-dependent protease